MDRDVKLLAAMLSPGDTLRTQCPKCHGGASGEASFSVTRDEDGVVFKCFRNKCGYSGGYGKKKTSMIRTTETDKKTMDKLREAASIWGRGTALPDSLLWWLSCRFLYDVGKTLAPSYDPQTERVLVPFFNNGAMAGFISRRFFEDSSPKALTYKLRAALPTIGFYRQHLDTEAPLIIVEDVFSAGAMSELGVPACALLGTDTTEDGWLTISNYANRYTNGAAVIALDEDALDKAAHLCTSKRSYFRHLSIYVLQGKDIKDLAPKEREVIRDELTKGR